MEVGSCESDNDNLHPTVVVVLVALMIHHTTKRIPMVDR